jgi:uncharacterized protein YyaL (SSP411 family)
LIDETSPYLLQHAHNPVDWLPWGDAPFARAAAEDKPIFLSIGYAACHWCHVMERESFEDETTAAYLNEHFISIKVDREERPDVDALYMSAVQLLTGAGGWPMSVFLTPDGKPFYGGTYFPPEDRWGRPGFVTVLKAIAASWTGDREKILNNGVALMRAIDQMAAMDAAPDGVAPPTVEILQHACDRLLANFDATWGGFGGAPKFPPSMALELLLREHRRTGRAPLLDAVRLTLDRMARGGMCDQIGGGFARYSTDHQWLVPHFEKMLYDNALLALCYFDAWRAGGNPDDLRIGRETLDYLLREMVTPEGALASAQDADSEGVEGKYYLWTPMQVKHALDDPERAALVCDFFGIADGGNWAEGEGGSIANIPVPLEEFAARRGIDPNALRGQLDAARGQLLAVRAQRIPPLKDDKALTGWNGLAISALAHGTQTTGDPRYAAAAVRAADFILSVMRDDAGGLLRASRHGRAAIPGFLEDYAALAVGLIDLYETTFDPRWLTHADALVRGMLDRFADPGGIGFFTSDGSDRRVAARLKDFYDGASPSGNSLAVHALLRLGRLLDREPFIKEGRRLLDAMASEMAERSPAMHHMLCALSDALVPGPEIVILGPAADPATRALIEVAWRRWLPGRIIVHAEAPSADHPAAAWLAGRVAVDGRPTAYVCRENVCHAPVRTVEGLEEQLSSPG